ncbi:MAG: Uma2 family endonuclease [Planctomycetota bacterium]
MSIETSERIAANAALTCSVSDALVDLGGISPQRLLGSDNANVDSLVQAHHEGRLCELVDGYLVEKAVGFRESLIAMAIARFLGQFVDQERLGLISGADGFITFFPDLIRGPDVAYISFGRLPGGQVPSEAYPKIVPELVVEVISQGNTRAEMARKRREYFHAGVELVWMVDPVRRTIAVYTSSIDATVLYEEDTLDGGTVLSGWSIKVRQIFAVLDRDDLGKK